MNTAQRMFRIRSFSDPYFPAFRLNTEIYGESLRIQSECGKTRTRKTPNKDIFLTVEVMQIHSNYYGFLCKISILFECS